jgi:VWFA-related protein
MARRFAYCILLLAAWAYLGASQSAQGTTRQKATENPAIQGLRRAAGVGDVQAAYNLAVMYDTGQGVPQDYAKAATWYRKAADHGMAKAQFNLAVLYANGLGVPQDLGQAAAWYRRAADLEYAPAQFNLAVQYENGRGVAHDDTLAVSWYRKAAEHGYAPAMFNLAAMYFRGQGVTRDDVEAFTWRQLAAVRATPEKQQQYAESRDALATQLTPEQVNSGLARAGAWLRAFETAAATALTDGPKEAKPEQQASALTDVPKEAKPEQQVFKAAIDVVEAETVVVDAAGQQVRSLIPSDFSLTVDGQEREIASAMYIAFAGAGPEDATPSGSVSHNLEGRRLVLAVDEGNITAGSGRGAVLAAQRLVAGLGPADRVAFVSLPGASKIAFTKDFEQVQAALPHVVGRAPRPHGDFSLSVAELYAFSPGASPTDRQTQERVIDRECPTRGHADCADQVHADAALRLHEMTQRSQAALHALSGVFSALARLPGRKTVVLISEGLSVRPDHSDAQTIATIGRQAAAARATLYTILLDGQLIDVTDSRSSPSRAEDQAFEEEGLRDLTNRAGGALLRVVGKEDAAFARLAQELAGYYLIAFPVKPGDRDGSTHAIKVTTHKRDLTIRTRAEFIVGPRS